MSVAIIIVLSIIGIFVIYLGVSVFRFKNKMGNYDASKDSQNVLILNDNTFYHKISSGIALVDFWAPWCQPCKIQGPIVSELADDYEGKAKIGKIDIDKNKKIAHKLGIRNIPTIVVFKNGKEIDRVVGLKAKNYLRKVLDRHL